FILFVVNVLFCVIAVYRKDNYRHLHF
ncbi:hypothetical protein EHRUM3_06510, partial [Ehrlichia ruminantium]